MPNPFPGMNPYLEEPVSWRDVHTRLIAYIADALAPQIRPRYVARVEESVLLDDFGHELRPDVAVSEMGGNGQSGNGSSESHRYAMESGGTAVAVAPLILELPEDPPHRFIEILDPRGGEVVTVIEVLCPTNKRASGYGQRKYTQKVGALVASDVNIVEIDLLRGGLPTTIVEWEPGLRVPAHDYIFSVSRGANRQRYEVYPFRLRDSVPPIAIPLRRADADAVLQLAPLIERIYENGSYDQLVDYGKIPPLPPLNDNDARWMEELLK